MKLSVVIAVFNEEENVIPLAGQLASALKGLEHEVIFVDDGSTDRTLAALQSIQQPNLKIIELRKNYGQSLALMAGIDEAQGDYIGTLDGDMQNDPADIPMMLALAEKGDWDLVAGLRSNRKDGLFFRKIPSLLANWIIRTSTGVRMRDYGCALKIFKKDIAKDLGLYGELHRFIPVLAHLEGAKFTQVDVRHHPRRHGKSKYGLGRTFKVVSDLLLMLFLKKYLQRPMHLFGNTGVVLALAGAAILGYLGFLKLMGNDIWGKPLLMLGILLAIAGIQLVTIGIVVEIQMRTYYESQGKRPYKVRKVYESGKTANEGGMRQQS